MTTLNLDTQCALAQGWKFHRSVQDRGLWEEVWILPDGSQIPCSQYRPSTDLNQAVDFAESAKLLWFEINIEQPTTTTKVYEVICYNDGDMADRIHLTGECLPVLICRATLAALGRRRDDVGL